MHLLDPGGHLHLRPAVDDRCVVRSEAQRCPDRVHRHVPAADHGDILAAGDRGVVFRKTVCLHQVGTGQILVRRVDPAEIFPGDVHENRCTGADAEEDRVESLGKELVHRLDPADDGVRDDFDPQFLQVVHFRLDDRLRQTKFRDPINQDAARLVQGLEDRHIIAEFHQVARDRQTRGAGTDHRHPFPVGLRPRGYGNLSRPALVIRGEPLQSADRDRLPLFPEDADLLALILLRADTAADGRKRIGFLQLECRLHEFSFGDERNKSRDVHIHRAAGNTARLLTLDAALRLGNRKLLGITRGNLVEIADPNLRILLGHLVSGNFFLLGFDFVIFHGICTYRLPSIVFPGADTS